MEGKCPHCGKSLDGSQKIGIENAEQKEISPEGKAELPGGDLSGVKIDLDFDPRKERRKDLMGEAGKEVKKDSAPAIGVKKIQIEIDKELESLSGYGPAPEGWLGTVAYMFRVMSRKKELRAQIERIREEIKEGRKNLDGDLLVIGRKKYSEPGAQKAYPVNVEKIKIAKEKLESAGSTKDLEYREMEENQNYIDEEIVRLQNEAQKYRVEEETMAKIVEEHRLEFQKARARMQRFEIEERNIKRLMTEKAESQELEKLKIKMAQVEDEKKLFAPQLESLRSIFEESERKLALIRSSIVEIQGKISIASKRKANIEMAYKKKIEEMDRHYHSLQEEYNDAIRDLAVASLENDDLPEEFKVMKEKISKRLSSIRGLEDKAKKLENAMNSYSRGAFQRAYILLGSSVLAIIALVVILLAIL